MASAASFPSVDTGAMTACASGLKSIASSMSDTGTNVLVLQQAVTGNEAWKGQGASQWQTVTTGRVADADLTNEVLDKAGTLLDQLASDLEAEQKYYNTVNGEMQGAAGQYNPRFNPAPPNWAAQYISDMNSSVARANNVLHSAGDDFLALAALADEITATTAANRAPGEPAGPASASNGGQLRTLTILLGSVTGNRTIGMNSEQQILSELGLTKNTGTFRLNIPGAQLTPGGQVRGTIPEAINLSGNGSGYVVEIKTYTGEVSARYQIRLEETLAQANGEPFWVIVPEGATVTSDVQVRAEGTGGGVLVRTGPNSYQQLDGNPVKVEPGMKVTGYQRITTGGSGGSNTGGSGTSDPQAPGEPVNPSDTTGEAPAPAAPDAPDPVGPGDDPDPIIDPLP